MASDPSELSATEKQDAVAMAATILSTDDDDLETCRVCGSRANLMRSYMPKCKGCGQGKQCVCYGRICGPCRAFFAAETLRRRETPGRGDQLTAFTHQADGLSGMLWKKGNSSCGINCPRCQAERYERCLTLASMLPSKVGCSKRNSIKGGSKSPAAAIAATPQAAGQTRSCTECAVCGTGSQLVRAYMPKCAGCGMGKQCSCYGRVCMTCRGFFVTEANRRRNAPDREETQLSVPHANPEGEAQLWQNGCTTCGPNCPRCQLERFRRCITEASMDPELVGRLKNGSSTRSGTPLGGSSASRAAVSTKDVSACGVCGSTVQLLRSYMPACRGCGLGQRCGCYGRVCAPCAGFFAAETIQRAAAPDREARLQAQAHANPEAQSACWADGQSQCARGCAPCRVERFNRCKSKLHMLPQLVGEPLPTGEAPASFEGEAPNQGEVSECAVCGTESNLTQLFMPACRGCDAESAVACECFGRVCEECAEFFLAETLSRFDAPERAQLLCNAAHTDPPKTLGLWEQGVTGCAPGCSACTFERYFRCQDEACLQVSLVPLPKLPDASTIPPPSPTPSGTSPLQHHDPEPAPELSTDPHECVVCGKSERLPRHTYRSCESCAPGAACSCDGEVCLSCVKFFADEARARLTKPTREQELSQATHLSPTQTLGLLEDGKVECATGCDACKYERFFNCVEDGRMQPALVTAPTKTKQQTASDRVNACAVCGNVNNLMRGYMPECRGCGLGKQCVCYGRVCAPCRRFFSTETTRRRESDRRAAVMAELTHQNPLNLAQLWQHGNVHCSTLCPACIYDRYQRCLTEAHMVPDLVGARQYRRTPAAHTSPAGDPTDAPSPMLTEDTVDSADMSADEPSPGNGHGKRPLSSGSDGEEEEEDDEDDEEGEHDEEDPDAAHKRFKPSDD